MFPEWGKKGYNLVNRHLPPDQIAKLNLGWFAKTGLQHCGKPKQTQTMDKNKTQNQHAVLAFRRLSYLHLGFKTLQDNRSTLIGAWEEVQNGQSLVKPKAFIYYLICLPRRLRSWWKHLVFIVAQLLPNCTAGEIKAQGVTGRAQPGPSPLWELCSSLQGRDHTPCPWSSGGDL